ncbi:unnamed protein product [Caenorhabditis sp. 36 PRJEB53466]|nr:unnamed protein product [Caenorhabditis sp. 36 PRJEB53466]
MDDLLSKSSGSSTGLHTYNSAADLTSGHVISLEKNEYLFDLNTKNSCTRPLESFIKLLSTSNVAKEFSNFATLALSRLRTVDAFFDHPTLNKIGEIQVYEGTRVRATHKQGHNYMNASWIDGYRDVRKFIVAPSPIADTVDQFWRCIYERNSFVLVTLSELTDEHGKPFVPVKTGEPLVLEEMSIEIDNIRKVRQGCHSAVLKVTPKGHPAKTVLLISYIGWGPMGYPQRPSDVLDLVADMNHMKVIMKQKNVADKKVDEKHNTPITLVCFDGFGRSCTVAALDILCQRLEASHAAGAPFVDILDTIARLRMLRGGACNKADQFLFLSLAVLEYAIRHRLIEAELLSKINLDGFIIRNNAESA